jgi:hypothetical protein
MRKIVAGLVALALGVSMSWGAEPVAAPREGRPAVAAQYPPAFGTIRSVNDSELVLADALGKQWTFKIGEGTQAQQANPGERTTGGAPASLSKLQLSDLKPGMLVHVQYGRSERQMQAQRIVAQQTPTPGGAGRERPETP